MIRFNENSVFSIAIFVFGIVILLATLELRHDVALVPRIMSVCLILLSGVQMLSDLFPAIQQKWFAVKKKEEQAATEMQIQQAEEWETKEMINKRYFFIGWMVLFAVLILFSSMIWAALISMFVYMKWISKESWRMSIIYSASVALMIYLVFVVGFELDYFM